MRKILSVLLASFAFFGVFGAFLALAGGGIPSWFAEDAASFVENASSRWSYPTDAASVSGGRILITDTSGSPATRSVVYETPSLASDVRGVTLDYSAVSFDLSGLDDLVLSERDVVGIQLVDGETEGSYVFALFNPQGGSNSWVVTSFAATLATPYDIRMHLLFGESTKTAVYAVRPAGTGADFKTIGTVLLPAHAEFPTEIHYAGSGALTQMTGSIRTGASIDYHLWDSASGILTWKNGSSFDAGTYAVFDTDTELDTSVLITGNVPSDKMPGYEGTTLTNPADVFLSSSGKKYKAPGHVLRFTGMGFHISWAVSNFHLGGLVVEAESEGWMLAGTGSTSDTRLGDLTGTTPTWFVFADDFRINRGGAVRFYGDVNIEVASGKIFVCNADSTQKSVVLDETTAGALRFYGAGQMKVGQLTATGGTTLDFSRLDAARTTPFLVGNVTVDATTRLVFPAGFEPTSTFALCSGELSGLASGLRTVTVGGVETNVYLSVSGSTVTRGEPVARAKISSDTSWSSLVWEPGAEYHAGIPVELTFANDAKLVFDMALSGAGALTVRGEGAATFDLTSQQPSFASLTVPETCSLTLANSASAAKSWSLPMTVAGALTTRGGLKLQNGANVFSASSRLAVESGVLTLSGGARALSSKWVEVASGATLELATEELINFNSEMAIDVCGTLTAGSVRLSIGNLTALVLHDGAKLASGTGCFDFVGVFGGVRVADGSATITARIRNASTDTPFNVDAGATLVMANTAWYDTEKVGFRKTGAGTILFASTAKTDYSSAVRIAEGSVEFAGGMTFAGPLTMLAGATLKATASGATMSGAFTQDALMFVDCSALSSSGVTVLTVANGSAHALENVKATTGGWSLAKSGTKLVATTRTATTWDYADGIFTWGGPTGSDNFKQGVFTVYDPVAKADTSTKLTGNVASTAVPGYVGTSILPYTVFSSEDGGNYLAPGYVMRFTSTKAGTIEANFTDLHFGGLIFESGASGYKISHVDTTPQRTTHIGDSRANGVETRFVFNESVEFSRQGAFLLHGKVNFEVASGKTVTLNAARTLDAYQPTLDAATHAEFKAHGLGSVAVRTLVATGDVTLDFSDLASTRTTPYFVASVANTGNLKIDNRTSFNFPTWLKPDASFTLCAGSLVGATNGLRKVSFGGHAAYAYLSFLGNQVSFSTNAVNTATLKAGTYQWSDILWNGGWKSGLPVVLYVTGDVKVFRHGETEPLESVTFDGPYEVGFGYDAGTIDRVEAENGATLVDLTYTWIGPDRGGMWESGSNWECGGAPGEGAEVIFKRSADVMAHIQVSGRLHLFEGVTLTLRDSCGGAFQGVSGGSLVKAGSGTLRLDADATSGYAVEGAEVAAEGGTIVFAGATSVPTVRNLKLTLRGGVTAVEGTTFTAKDTLRLDGDSGTAGLTPRREGDAKVELAGTASIVKDGSGLVVLDCAVGTAAKAYAGSVCVNGGTLAFAGRVAGSLSGEGQVGVLEGTVLQVEGGAFPAGGFVGAGTVKVGKLPSEIAAAAFTGIGWTGTLWLDGLNLEAFNPSRYGNPNSSVRLSGCSGYFRSGSFDVPTRLSMNGESSDVAFNLTYAWPGVRIGLSELVGAGELTMNFVADDGGASEICIDAHEGFTGALTVLDGGIAVENGARATIGRNAVWTPAVDGTIEIAPGSRLTDLGRIGGKVTGGGEVRYTGDVGSAKIEEDAAFTEFQWTGTVSVVDATLAGTRLDRGGNDLSRVVLDGVVASNLVEQTVTCPVEVTGKGVTIAAARATVTFSHLTGEGPATFAAGNLGFGLWRFEDVVDYSCVLTAETGEGAFGIGADATYQMGGSISFADGATVKTLQGWSASRAFFGDSLKVIGNVGELLVTAYDSPVDDYNRARLSLDGTDPRVVYRLMQGGDGDLYVMESATPPMMDVENVGIDFGPDMTNVAVSVTIANYWEGISYKGPTYLRVWIYDEAGPVSVVGGLVTGNGRYELGTLTLPDADGRNYTYVVEIEGGETIYARREILEERVVSDPIAHLNTGWIYETAETFPPEAEGKTGEWTWIGDRADENLRVEDEQIRIGGVAAGEEEFAQFEADEEAHGIVKVDLFFTVDDDSQTAVSTKPGMQGAFILSGEPGDEDFQVWNPETGDYESVDAAFTSGEARHHLQTTFNYVAGTVSYALDGCTLTNAHHGTGLFALTAEQIAANALQRVKFFGGAAVELMTGGEYGTNVAATISGGVTNEFKSLDAAIASLTNGVDATLRLLWDSTWKPLTNDVGRTYGFDLNGHRLLIDEAVTNRLVTEGYRVIDNKDGSYTIGVVEFYVTFDPNAADATGGMPAMPFSVTNLVFNLVSNKFAREGFDFAKWRTEEEEDRPVRTYEDGGVIDLGEFGLADLKLQAQWRVKVRTITVEATDEYVYLERVMTNGVNHAGVRYFAHTNETEAAKGRGTALIPVMNGSDLVVTFSTDIEKMLNYSRLNSRHAVVYDGTLTNAMPKVVSGIDEVLTEIQYWAMSRGISLDALAKSAFARSSYRLNSKSLLTEETKVEISAFKVTPTGCSFRVTIDGEPLDDASRLKGMVKVTDNLAGDWTDATDFSVDAEGTVSVTTAGAGSFVKIVIPTDASLD